MSLQLPRFSDLIANYPLDSTELMMSSIDGAVSSSWILNGCVIRMCKAFNYVDSGVVLNKIYFLDLQNKNIFPQINFLGIKEHRRKFHDIPEKCPYINFETVAGNDNKRYNYRVTEFFNFLNHKYNTYDYVLEKAFLKSQFSNYDLDNFKGLIKNKNGIICFKAKFGEDVPGSRVTGHFTLWNGKTCLVSETDYFKDERTTAIYFWRC